MSVSIESIAEKTFDNFKKITPGLVAVSVLTGLLLFLPKKVLGRMNLDDLPVLWSRIIGIVFLLSIALIVTMCLASVISLITAKLRINQVKTERRKKYQNLSHEQKEIIVRLLKSKNKTIELSSNSGDTVYLEENLFIHAPRQAVSIGRNNEFVLKYVPQPWVIDMYNKEPTLFV